MDNYLFYFPNCGFQDDITCNYIEVITLINSSNIITMYPTKLLGYGDICDLYKKPDEKVPIKVKTGLERFQNRYKIFD